MIQLEKLKKTWFFKEVILKQWEILFDEGEKDWNIYIIYDGELAVQRSIKSEVGNMKTLGLLWIWNIVGEGALSRDLPKEVRVISNRNTILLSINGKNTFQDFLKNFPDEWYNLLITIIEIANSRLLRANKEVTANYEVSRAIANIWTIDMKSIYWLLETFHKILEVDQILYFEKNLVMPDYYKLKYDSQAEHKLQNIIIKFPGNILNKEILEEESIHLLPYSRYTALLLWKDNHGFLCVARERKDFNENEEKLLQNVATSFVWVIHQKEILDEQKNKIYIKWGL